MMIAVLLSSTMSLSAQEGSQSRSRIPDPKPYADLLKDESKPAVKKVPSVESRPVLESKPAREKSPAKPAVVAPAATPEEILEIDRILAEARMHLDEIEKESGDSEEEAQDVFDDFLARITARLRELKLKEAQKQSSTEEASADNAGIGDAKVAGQGSQESGISEGENSAPGSSVSVPATSEDHPKPGKEPTVRQTVRVEVSEKSSLIDEVDRVLSQEFPLHKPAPSPAVKSGTPESDLEVQKEADGSVGKDSSEWSASPIETILLRRWAAQLRALAGQMEFEAAGSKSGGK